MTAITPRRLAAGAALAVAGTALWWRRRPSACPYAFRLSLALPRPGIGVGRLLDTLAPQPGERILEIGPGTGHYTLPVAERLGEDGRLDAIDIQPDMLAELERRAGERDARNVRPKLGDARSLPHEDAAFDAVFMVTVLGEVPDQDAALREVRRVLRPGGRVVVGEIAADPHMVTAGALRARAESAGLRMIGREGSPLAYFGVLSRA